jgi:hypothetical protein
MAWPLRELAARIEAVIDEHFETTPIDPSEEGLPYDSEIDWTRSGEPIADVIAEIAQLEPEAAEAVRKHLSEETAWDAHEGGYEDPFGIDAYYEEGRPDTGGFHESWEFFRQEIRSRARFFSRSAQGALDEIFGDLAKLKAWEGTPAIKQISPTEDARFFYRARIAYSEAELQDILAEPVKNLGPPPSRLARAGRMNAAGISVFYGAIEADTCVAEVRAPVGSYVVHGQFELILPVRVLDLNVLAKVATDISWFHLEFATRSNRAAFLRHLVNEISQPILPRDEEFEYLATQAVSEYLASCLEPRLDGIIYRSAQIAGQGQNVVLFNRSAGVQPYAVPHGTKLEINMGRGSADDYDDGITVWETVQAIEVVEKVRTKSDWPNFNNILGAARWEPPDRVATYDQSYGEPTLKLDVQNIEVFQIKAVSYEKRKRSVTRYREQSGQESAFLIEAVGE